MSELVNNPSHYGGKDNPYEVIKVIDAWDLDFNLGNAIKYIPRAGEKLYPGKTKLESEITDLKKSAWYLNHKIALLEAEYNELNPPKPKASLPYLPGEGPKDIISYNEGDDTAS